jgi:hypothetical protein
MVACPQGHRAYAGYLAEAAFLRPRLQWLDDRAAAGDAAPDPETARRSGIWPAPSDLSASPALPPTRPYATEGTRPAAAPSEGPGIQVLLLSLGAGLLIVAGIVFMAVVWSDLGSFGQVAVMGLATLGFGVAAVRLAHRLPGTAEALAVVAFGLGVIDVVAAPALGLVPDEWLHVEQPYLPLATCVGAAVVVWLGRTFALQAWVWLGWVSVAIGASLLSWSLALGPFDSDLPAAALCVSVVGIAAVALQAGPYVSARLAPDLPAMTASALVALILAAPAWLYWLSDLDHPAILGTSVTTLVVAAAAGVAWGRTTQVIEAVGATGLAGIGVGLALLLLPGGDSVWLAVVAAAAGVLLLVGLGRAGFLHAGLLASTTLWSAWALGRLAITGATEGADPVFLQVSVLLALVAATWFVVAWRGGEPVMAWLAAVVGELAWIALLPRLTGLPDVPERWALPFAVLLLGAGWVWHRSEPGESLGWLGPGVSVALLPSAFSCWGAPWVDDFSDQSTTEATVRLLLVLVASVAVVVVGSQLRLSGLLVPGAAALVIVGTAQVWTGLLGMPRWLGIAVAGTVLFVGGARIEWLRARGRRARRFVDDLR